MAITKEERARRDKLAEQGIKVCCKCGQEKPFSEFYKHKNKAYGLDNQCKICCKKQNQQYQQENKEKLREMSKKYYQENIERRRKYNKQYQQENKEKLREKKKKYRQENKEKLKELNKQWRQKPEVRERLAEKRKQYYQENKQLIKEYQKQYNRKNKEWIREKKKQYRKKPEVRDRLNKRYKERYQSDSMFKFSDRVRGLVKHGFNRKGWSKDSSTQEIIGCSWEQVVLWLGDEPSKEIHIDHVIPQSLAETPEEVKLLNHYTNLQLLPSEENITKGNRYIRKQNLKRVLAHHPQPDKLKEIVKRSGVEII